MEKKPLRILIIDGKLICGGVESFIMNIYRLVDKEKIQFDFLVHYAGDFYYDDEVKKLGGKIYKLTFRDDNNIFKYKRDLRNFFYSHPEYQIVWGHMDGLASIYLKIAKQYGVKTTICHSHITRPEYSVKGLIKKILRKNTWKYSDYRFACSSEAGRYLYGNHPYRLIHNAIDVKKFSFNEDVRERIRKIHNWQDKIVIGHIGRFFEQKNHNFLIKIFYRLSLLNDDFVLCLCGDGDNKVLIEEQVRKMNLDNKVVFTGNISNVNEYYQAFDFFVMPSLYEGLPVTGVEAQTSGLKCIFSNTISSEINLVPENVSFLPIKEDDIDQWVEEIIKNLKYCRKDCSNLIKASGYSVESLVNDISSFMESVS